MSKPEPIIQQLRGALLRTAAHPNVPPSAPVRIAGDQPAVLGALRRALLAAPGAPTATPVAPATRLPTPPPSFAERLGGALEGGGKGFLHGIASTALGVGQIGLSALSPVAGAFGAPEARLPASLSAGYRKFGSRLLNSLTSASHPLAFDFGNLLGSAASLQAGFGAAGRLVGGATEGTAAMLENSPAAGRAFRNLLWGERSINPAVSDDTANVVQSVADKVIASDPAINLTPNGARLVRSMGSTGARAAVQGGAAGAVQFQGGPDAGAARAGSVAAGALTAGVLGFVGQPFLKLLAKGASVRAIKAVLQDAKTQAGPKATQVTGALMQQLGNLADSGESRAKQAGAVLHKIAELKGEPEASAFAAVEQRRIQLGRVSDRMYAQAAKLGQEVGPVPLDVKALNAVTEEAQRSLAMSSAIPALVRAQRALEMEAPSVELPTQMTAEQYRALQSSSEGTSVDFEHLNSAISALNKFKTQLGRNDPGSVAINDALKVLNGSMKEIETRAPAGFSEAYGKAKDFYRNRIIPFSRTYADRFSRPADIYIDPSRVTAEVVAPGDPKGAAAQFGKLSRTQKDAVRLTFLSSALHSATDPATGAISPSGFADFLRNHTDMARVYFPGRSRFALRGVLNMVHPSRGASHLGETASLYQGAEGITKLVSDETARGASQIGGGAVIGLGAGLMNKVRGGLFWNSIAALHDSSRLTQAAVLMNRLIRRGAAGVAGQSSSPVSSSP